MTQLRFSELSGPRQALIRRCQRLGFGTLRNIEVRDREPTFGATEVIIDLKLDSDNAPRPEQNLSNFLVCDEIRRLFSMLDDFVNATVDIEVRTGVPRRVFIKVAEAMHE
jgi:hypothetical protein